MRSLSRNKKSIWYATYSTQTELVDENGLYTGEVGVGYSAPTEAKVNVSAAKGEARTEMFGTDLNYSKTIVTDNDMGWDENTVLWIDIPALSGSSVTAYNYKVVSVAKSINSVTYAIKGVDVS